jgi:hypothetical protein
MRTEVSSFRIRCNGIEGSRWRESREWNMQEPFYHVISPGNQRQVIFRTDRIANTIWNG